MTIASRDDLSLDTIKTARHNQSIDLFFCFLGFGNSMSNILNIFLCVIIGIILFVAIVYSIEAAQAIASYSGYEADENLKVAHRYLSYTSSILLIVVAVLIIGIISLFIWGAGLIPRFGSTIVDFVFLIVILAAIAAGVIASIAAYDISKSPVMTADAKIQEAYSKAVIAAVASLGALGFIFFVSIAIWYNRTNVTKKDQELSQTNANKQHLVAQHRQQLIQQKMRLENRRIADLQSQYSNHQSQINNLSSQQNRLVRQAKKNDSSLDLTKKLANVNNKRHQQNAVHDIADKSLPVAEEII